MNMTHPDILKAERHGMPDPEQPKCHCPSCDRIVEQTQIFKCAKCGNTICCFCLYTNDTFMEHFCSEQIITYESKELYIPSQCYHEWCLEQMMTWQNKYFELNAKKAA